MKVRDPLGSVGPAPLGLVPAVLVSVIVWLPVYEVAVALAALAAVIVTVKAVPAVSGVGALIKNFVAVTGVTTVNACWAWSAAL